MRLLELIWQRAFWQSVLFSVGHIVLGFLISALLGIALAALAYRFSAVRQLLSPLTAAVKAVPVASFVILVLLWVSSRQLSIIISILIGFPVIYTNVLTGLDSTDVRLIEMARVFRIPFVTQLRAIYLYSVLPFLRSSLGIAMGLCWKSGVAAEVIGIPDGSIGEKLYEAKVYLETADLFCWTIVIVLLSIGCEKLLGFIMRSVEKAAAKQRSYARPVRLARSAAPYALEIKHLSKAFEGKSVLKNLSLRLENGRHYSLMGPSGCGKTTLLNLMLGLLKPDAGAVHTPSGTALSAVFQEDRLLKHMTAEANVSLVSHAPAEEINALLLRLGIDEESLRQPISAYSGGMKRRAALCRALLADFDILLLDEPYKGLDETTRQQVMDIVSEYTQNKTVLMVTHDRDETVGFESITLG